MKNLRSPTNDLAGGSREHSGSKLKSIYRERLIMEVTRRSFLLSAAAAAYAPAFLRATDKAGSKAPILGQGEHQYQPIHDWGELPRTIKYGNTHGVCQDAQGNIYVHHRSEEHTSELQSL